MQTNKLISRFVRTGTRLVILASMLISALITNATPAAAAPVGFDLYAVSGSMALPGLASVTVWGYNTTGVAATQPGGPTLIVNEGDVVTVTLHNQLGVSTGLLFQGQDMAPDRTGAPGGGTTSYTFTASRPGTYLYEAGLLSNAQYQAAMGLYGALIVQPATAGQAYNDPATAFDDEAVLVLSEIDPALSNSANPAAFDMRNYNPRYFLINGKAYPNTDAIPTLAGNRVLLRYLNAGIKIHSMSILGMHQVVIANDGSPLAFSHRMVAESFGPGQTVDTIATVPAAAADGSKFAIYDGNLMLRNSNVAGFGGMLTFLTISAPPPPTDTLGPVTSNVAYSAGTLTATVDDSATGGSNVSAAEYFLDTTGAPGAGAAMSGSFGSVTVNVSAAVVVPSGPHTLYVRGQDSQGNWGAFSSVLVNGGDASGPATTGLTVTPNPTNGSVSVAVNATGNDSASGGSNIAAAEYTIDGGTAVAMTVSAAAPVASLSGTIPAATVNALNEGAHVVAVRSQDAAGNWGAFSTLALNVDKSAPNTSGVSAAPNPNNGSQPINAGTLAVRVSATLTDPLSGGVQSNISAAEGFIDTVGANGTGFVFAASDGAFNSSSEAASSDIPLATILLLSNGNHNIYVHAKDAAGNWGPTSSTILTIDKTPPAVSGVSAAPNPTLGATSVTLSASATDVGTGVTQAEWFTGADPGVGLGTAMTVTGTGPWNLSAAINVSTWANGTYTLNVRARDAAGSWSTLGSTSLVVFPGLYFSIAGNSTVPGTPNSGNWRDTDIYLWNGLAFSRAIDTTSAGLNLPSGANVDGFDRVDATHFYMSFSGTVDPPGPLGNVNDEDVVYYSNGTWSLFYDGSVNGVTSNVDAISIVGGQLYFSLSTNTTPPGAGGAGDDADIYRWNGGSSYTRVVDASTIGIPSTGGGNANVDGFVRVDDTHFYMSFSNTNTTIPGLGAVQDEDVIYYNAGTWSVFFDGTVPGRLGTSNNLDIDAFDLP